MKPADRSFARRMDLTSLQLFVAVCELGSIGRAAEREFIAASAVSKRLSDLEATLETPLLYRHTRGVDLTPAGESLLHEWLRYAFAMLGGFVVNYGAYALLVWQFALLGAAFTVIEANKLTRERELELAVAREVAVIIQFRRYA